jgi:hypothetical protein
VTGGIRNYKLKAFEVINVQVPFSVILKTLAEGCAVDRRRVALKQYISSTLQCGVIVAQLVNKLSTSCSI